LEDPLNGYADFRGVELHEEDGNVFRGLFFALLFNLFLLLTGSVDWELWRLMR
jgi:hypothetical protein